MIWRLQNIHFSSESNDRAEASGNTPPKITGIYQQL